VPPLPGLGPLIAIPADVVGTLRALPRLFAQIDAMAQATRSLPRMEAAISKVSEDTRALTTLSEHMAQVAEATGPLPEVADAAQVLPPMYERMTGIESAMPTLVEVQQQLADRLPGRR
jgi:hypothetical protein